MSNKAPRRSGHFHNANFKPTRRSGRRQKHKQRINRIVKNRRNY